MRVVYCVLENEDPIQAVVVTKIRRLLISKLMTFWPRKLYFQGKKPELKKQGF